MLYSLVVENSKSPQPSGLAEDAILAQAIIAAQGEASEAEAELYRRFAPRVRLYGLRHL